MSCAPRQPFALPKPVMPTAAQLRTVQHDLLSRVPAERPARLALHDRHAKEQGYVLPSQLLKPDGHSSARGRWLKFREPSPSTFGGPATVVAALLGGPLALAAMAMYRPPLGPQWAPAAGGRWAMPPFFLPPPPFQWQYQPPTFRARPHWHEAADDDE